MLEIRSGSLERAQPARVVVVEDEDDLDPWVVPFDGGSEQPLLDLLQILGFAR